MRPLPTISIVACLLLTGLTSLLAGPPKLTPSKGVVLLRNGEILSGTIAHTGDYYYVSKPGSEIRLKASDVEKVADTMQELYLDKRSHLTPGKLQDCLDLAEWCIEQKLVEQADHELTAAAAIEPQHPRIPLLRRRLELADRSGAERTAPVPPVDTGPSNDELDRLVRGLPGHAVESFTSTIQPLLVNNCTASGCHGMRSPGKLHLLRLSLASPANRRLTQRNLYSVWQVVDVNEPGASPLLTQPIRPHGKAKGPIFSGREAAQYRQLVGWVYAATRRRRPADPPPEDAGEAQPVTARVGKNKPKKTLPKGVEPPVPSLDEEAVTGEPNEEDAASSELAAQDDSPSARSNKALTHDDDYTPVDPFDPEVFNRRYFPR